MNVASSTSTEQQQEADSKSSMTFPSSTANSSGSALIRELRGAAPSVVVNELDELLPPDLTNIVLQYMKHAPPRGRFVRSLGSYGKRDGQFYNPQGVAVWQDLVLVTDTYNARICVHRLSDGGFVRSFGRSLYDARNCRDPVGIAVSEADGLAFVTESPTEDDEVQCVSVWRLVDGSLVRRWGSTGSNNGQFDEPRGIAVSRGADRLVYVADCRNDRIQVFGVDGRFVRSFGSKGDGPAQLHRPTGICLDGGLLYVAEYYNHRISVLSASDGSFVRHIGLGEGSGDGQLNRPTGIAVGVEWVAVSELHNDRVSVFVCADGSFLHRWGSWGIGDNQFNSPNLMCWSESQGVLVVADSRSSRVVVYQ